MAVTLALQHSRALVIGSDISPSALALADMNRCRYAAANLLLVAADLLEPFAPHRASFDGIVANLPYIPSGQIDGLQPEVSRGDPRLALDGGPDGLATVMRLLVSVHCIMKDNGLLALELDPEQTDKVRRTLEEQGSWMSVTVHDDLTGLPRFVTARRRGRSPFNCN
jgi:release factor glutamine methyltransferase